MIIAKDMKYQTEKKKKNVCDNVWVIVLVSAFLIIKCVTKHKHSRMVDNKSQLCFYGTGVYWEIDILYICLFCKAVYWPSGVFLGRCVIGLLSYWDILCTFFYSYYIVCTMTDFVG